MISVGAVGNTLTTAIGGILGAPRIALIMAQDGLLPARLSELNQHGTPTLALLFSVIPCAVLAAFLDFEELADVCSAGALCSFSLVCASLVLLRSSDDAEGNVNTCTEMTACSAPS